jgi:Tfp pilus assembly protein PilF
MRVFFLAGVLLSTAALAQELVYRDSDPMAMALQHVDVSSPEWLAQVEKGMQQRDKSPWPHVQFGYSESLAGHAASARESYRLALDLAADPIQQRHVRWSYGWGLFNLGQSEAALEQWRQAAELHGGRPFWLPYTLAVGYWQSGEEDQALHWYTAAARSFPQRWGKAEGLARATAGWKAAEREAVDALFLRWRKQNPIR